jgi:GTP cyclohydrolase I
MTASPGRPAGNPGGGKGRDRVRAARAIEEFLRAMGHAPDGELARTGELVAEAWDSDVLEGVGADVAALLRDGALELPGGEQGIVGLRGIDVTSMCPHHLMPSHGVAAVAYRPAKLGAGLGRIAQVVHLSARRLVLQETLGLDVARAVVDGLGARGALCRLELRHTCLVARGERQLRSICDTVAFAGSFGEGGPDHAAALAWLSSATTERGG